MSAEPHRRVSVESYLAAERQAETKSEYLNDEVFAMADVYDRLPAAS